MNDTTRRYPRSLSEAFADERAQWLDDPRDHSAEIRFDRACWALAGVLLFSLFCAAALVAA